MKEKGNLPELIVTSAFLRQINDCEFDDGGVDDGELGDGKVDMTMRITKVQHTANQQYGPLVVLPESLTKSQ